MSSHVLTRPAAHWSSHLRSLFNSLLPARKVPGLPIEEMQALSDRLLDDIGVDPRSIPRPAHEEAVRLGLLDRGWQPPRRVNRH